MSEVGTDDDAGAPTAGLAAELPTTFGKYYLTEKLATGGMAEIYLAKIIGPGGFEKSLVIKQIHPKLSGQRHFVDLFVAEAKILVTLAHGNIVPVYELGVVDDTYFIAMDYIDGPTLYRLTETMARREGLMQPVLAAWITARILDGLDYAHRKGEGVIHRDLSPRNVMVSRDGEVKLVDFGIAVTLGEPGEAEGSQAAPTGSFPYMSPEQVRRESLTPQTDVFTVGVLFWEMLVGQRLFARNEAEATLDAVLREEIPAPSSKRPEVPAKLDELVMRALERDQAARWPNAGEMLAALNRYLYTQTEIPTSRDVAALVARFCPPETRRLPTHLEALAQLEERSGPATMPVADPDAAPPPAGPHTAVIPREGGSPPKGKRSVRHQTFATHVDLKDILDRAAPADDTEPIVPASPITKVSAPPEPEPDEPRVRAPSTVGAGARPSASPKGDAVRSTSSRRIRRPTTERPDSVGPEVKPPVSIGEPPSRVLLVLAGLGALGLAVVSVVIFFAKRDSILHDDAAVARDAAAMVAPVPVDAQPDAAAIDAGVTPIDTGHRDRPDAAVTLARPDATPHAAIDAGLVGRPDAAATAVANASIKVGADPWGEVYIDGVKMKGITPREYPVTAGHHDVRVVFPEDSPAPEKTFSLDLRANETRSVFAEFR